MRIEIPRTKVTIELGLGDFTVRTRKRCYLVAFAVAVHPRNQVFVQAGDHILWIRHWHGWNWPYWMVRLLKLDKE